MKKRLLAVAAFMLSLNGYAANDAAWMRYCAISPNGQQIAFSYKGDIYTVGVNGGRANQITTNPAHDTRPIWSPNGQQIAFASDRLGGMDIYIVDKEGGVPTRITTHSGNETPLAFKDNEHILFQANILPAADDMQFASAQFPQVYEVSTSGGRPIMFSSMPMEDISISADGKTLLYHDKKGYEDNWRKHHTSSITRDVWMCNLDGERSYKKLSTFNGEDRTPVWANADTYYYLSEQNGSFNVFKANINGGNPIQVTKHDKHPVRFLTRANNGTLCYGYDGGIYTLKEGEQPQKVNINVVTDKIDRDIIRQIKNSGATQIALSAEGKEVAFILRGDVYVTSTEYKTTKQITNTPQQERNVDFAPDGRSLVYASERDGLWQLYQAKIANKEEKLFTYATNILEEKLTNSHVTSFQPQYSPDGKEVAFLEDRSTIRVINLATKQVRTVMDGKYEYSYSDGDQWYQWSPDSRWILTNYIGTGGWNNKDVALVNASGNGEIHNLTNTGYFDESPQWVMGGNAIVFSTDRFGMRSHASWGSQNDIMIVYLNRKSYELARMSKEDYELYKEAEKKAKEEKEKAEKEKAEKEKGKNKDKKADESKKADEKKTEDIVVELDNIEERIVRLTSRSGSLSGFSMNKEGDKLFYMMSYDGSYDMWQLDLRDRSNKIIFNDVSGSLQWDKKMENMFIFGSKTGKYKGGNGAYTGISIRGEMNMDLAAEREYMFDRIYRQEKERFYHVDMHGVDWNAMRDNYARFLPHINNNFDFAEMASEWLGELNVSHTGCSFSPSYDGNSDITADLGLFYDFTHKGNGLKVSEIIVGGPFDKATSQLKKGDIIEKINGTEISEGMDYYPLLNRLSGKRTLISIYRPADKKRWEEVVKPVSRGSLSDQLYKRWVKQRAGDVERLSGGRLGYVHIESMGDASFRTIYADILGKYNHCDGIVIDTRFNGGGRLHEDIEILFSGEKYLTQVVRGKEACDMPSRRYNKPSIMITCEANYSNAHGTPWVYQHRGIGKVVGMPVPGTMTSVTWERLQDASLVFGIPVIGYRTADGSYLENKQLEPDIKVANSPELIVTGRDEQLETAVKALLEQIDAEKKQKK